MELVELDPRRLAARLRLHHALHRRLVAGAPGVGERRPVDAPALRRRQRLALANDRAAPVDDGAEDVEHERADGAAVRGGQAHRFAPRQGRTARRARRRDRDAAATRAPLRSTTGASRAASVRSVGRRPGAALRPGGVERLAQRRERAGDDAGPVRRRLALHPVAAAAAEVLDREQAQQRRLDHRVERGRVPGDERAAGAAHEVDAARQPGAAERAEDAAGDQAAAERQAAAQQVGLEADQRAGDRAAPHRRLRLVEAQAQVVAGGEPLADLALGGAAEAVQREQLARVGAHLVVEASGERRAARPPPAPARRCRCRSPRRPGAGARARRRRRAASRSSSRSAPGWRRSPARRRRRSRRDARATRRAGAPSPAAWPRAAPPRRRANSVSSCTQQRANASSGSTARTCGVRRRGWRASAPPRRLRRRRARGAPSWLSEHDDRLADPAEQLHLGLHVAGRLDLFGRVDEVEQRRRLRRACCGSPAGWPRTGGPSSGPRPRSGSGRSDARPGAAGARGGRCRRSRACPTAAGGRRRSSRPARARRRTR